MNLGINRRTLWWIGSLLLAMPWQASGRVVYTYTNNFDETIGHEWSSNATDWTPGWGSRHFLGLFRDEKVTLAFHDLPQHESAVVTFDLFIVGTWYGNVGTPPNIWWFTADGDQYVYRTTFSNFYSQYSSFYVQSYPGQYPDPPAMPPQTNAAEKNKLGYGADAVYKMRFEVSHQESNLVLAFQGKDPMDGGLWGMDNIRVELQAPPANALPVLKISSGVGGAVVDPGEGDIEYDNGGVTEVTAVAAPGYVFSGWTGTAVTRGMVKYAGRPQTEVHLDFQGYMSATLKANYEQVKGLYVDDNAQSDPGPGDPLVSDPKEDGSRAHPFDSIQKAINASIAGVHESVIVLNGTYRGPGNRNIDPGGRKLTIRSLGLPEACVIDCEKQDRGFYVHSNEKRDTVINGFTIKGGRKQDGAGICCEGFAGPILSNCILEDNVANGQGNSLYTKYGGTLLKDSQIKGMGGEVITVAGDQLEVGGLVQIETATWSGPGRILLAAGATLELTGCTVTGNVAGPGRIEAPGDLVIADKAELDLTAYSGQGASVCGTVRCGGLLHVQDEAKIKNATVEPASLLLEQRAVLGGCTVNLKGLLSQGQVLVKDNVLLSNNTIKAESDNFLTFDKSFTGQLTSNKVELRLSREQTLEARGRTLGSCGVGGIQFEQGSRMFDRTQWELSLLEIEPGSVVTLTDQIHDQSDGQSQPEALYAERVIQREGATLDFAGVCIMARDYQSFAPIDFNDPGKYRSRVQVSSEAGVSFANGIMRMSVDAEDRVQAKGRFDRCSEDKVLIRFRYLFDSSSTELLVYLSDISDIGDRNPVHTRQVARITPPPAGRPGAAGGPYWADYEGWALRGGLDLSKETYVELELVRRPKTQAQVFGERGQALAGRVTFHAATTGSRDSMGVVDWQTRSCGGYCMDFTSDYNVDADDMRVGISGCGHGLNQDSWCLDGIFSRDGFLDHHDVPAWDWVIRDKLMNLCVGKDDMPLWVGVAGSPSVIGEWVKSLTLMASAQSSLPDLLILGKRQKGSSSDDVLKDRIYGLALDGTYTGAIEQAGLSDRWQMRLVRGTDGQVYVINTTSGVMRLDGQTVVGVTQVPVPSEPRVGRPATVQIGIQDTGGQSCGRPVLDAAVTDTSVYVVPAVVAPQTGDPYLAGARIWRSTMAVTHIYDDPSVVNGQDANNPNLTGLRDIEVDASGNAYILNVQRINRSTMLWKYNDSAQVQKKVSLDDLKIVDPVGMTLSKDGLKLYMGTGQYGEDTSSTWIYVLWAGDLTLSRRIQVKGLQRTTSIAEDAEGVIWVVGFNLDRVDAAPRPSKIPGYRPVLARIEKDSPASVEAIPFDGVAGDLALPMSIVYTKAGQE